LIERERKNEWSAPKLPLTISATYLTFCFVVVGVVELAAIVVELEAEITVVVEEGVIHRRGSLFLAPSEEKSAVVLVPPLRYQIYTNSLAPTSWKDSQLQDEEKIRRERVKRDKSHFQLLYLAEYSEATKTDFFN
jgi:hypothetical protein